MKIAAVLDSMDELTNECEGTFVSLFEERAGVWVRLSQVPLALDGLDDLASAKARLRLVRAQLDGCDVCLIRSLRGFLYLLLQELGLRMWKSEGPLVEQLKQVACEEKRRTQRKAESVKLGLAVGDLGNGHHRVDLEKALREQVGSNSRELLIPILERGGFSTLEIVCDHLPRWFEAELTRLELVMTDKVSLPDRNGLRVFVSAKGGAS